MNSNCLGRLFFGVLFVAAPILFIIATIYRLMTEGFYFTEGGGSSLTWIGCSILAFLWLLKAFAIMTSTSSNSDAERAYSWYQNEWLPMYQNELALYERWRTTHRDADYQALLQYEKSMERWKKETLNKIIALELGSAGHLQHYTWGNKEEWDYLDATIKDNLGIHEVL